MMKVLKLWPPEIGAASSWDGVGPVEVVLLRGHHHNYPYLIKDSRGNKAWVHSVQFTEE